MPFKFFLQRPKQNFPKERYLYGEQWVRELMTEQVGKQQANDDWLSGETASKRVRWMDELGFYVPSTVFQSFLDDSNEWEVRDRVNHSDQWVSERVSERDWVWQLYFKRVSERASERDSAWQLYFNRVSERAIEWVTLSLLWNIPRNTM